MGHCIGVFCSDFTGLWVVVDTEHGTAIAVGLPTYEAACRERDSYVSMMRGEGRLT